MINRFEIFTKQIAKISRSIRKIKAIKTCEFNLTTPCVNCLYYLYKHSEGLTAKELCSYCEEDKAAISRTVDYLEKNNFISCTSTATKRYNSTLILTDKGEKVGKKAVDIIDNILEGVSTGVSAEERNSFYETLFKITNNLQKICENLGEKI